MNKKKFQSKSGLHRHQKGQRSIAYLAALGGVFLVAAALFTVWWAGRPLLTTAEVEVEGAPNLKVNQEVLDYGDVPVGEWVSASFEISNTGDQPLRFSKNPYIEVIEGC